MKRQLCIFTMLLFAILSTAQTNIRQRQLTMDNGLSTNAIRHIAQDKRGFIWIGTANGLCRYDGAAVHCYRLSEFDAMHGVNAQLMLDDGDLLVANRQAVYRFRFDTEEFQPLPIEKDIDVTSMTRDLDGNLWVSTRNQGIVRYSDNGDEPQVAFYHLNEAGDNVDHVYADANNQLWALCKDSPSAIWRLNKNTNQFAPVDLLSPQPYGSVTMLQDSEQRLWIGTWEHGLMLMDADGTLHPMPIMDSGHCQHIRALFELSPTRLLVGCDDGLWLFDTQQHTYTLYAPLRFVQAIARDHEGGLWVGTAHSGVTYLSPIAQRFTHSPVGLTARICEDQRGNIWMTREDGGLSCYRNHREVGYFNGRERLANLNIHSLCADGDKLWIGTYSDGVYAFSIPTGQLRHYGADNSEEALYDPNSCTLLCDRNGAVWVATMEGLCRYNDKTDRFERKAKVTSVPTDIDEDDKGRLWVSTQDNGIWRYDGKSGKVATFRYDSKDETSLSDNIVNSLLIDGKGTVWAGTQSGLCRYNEQSENFERIRLDVPHQLISAIIEDQGVLWLSSDCGVLRYEAGKSPLRFTRQDGLGSEQFQPSSVLKGSDGCIYFGSTSGFDSFYPYQIKVNQLSPAIFITQLELNNQPIEVGTWHLPTALSEIGQLDLWNNDKVFSLSFASLSYCSPEKNMYAYKLEGFDKDWNNVGHEQKATYTNLPAGKYTFYVRATNNDGIWSEQTARLQIEVHPPYWLSTYAKIFYVVLFIVLVYAFIRFRLYMTERRHRKEIERLNAAKQEEMRQARTEFFTMIAHEIRTPVSLIIGPLEQMKNDASVQPSPLLDTIDRNAHRLLELVNQLLDFRKVEQNHMEMNFAPQNLRELLQSIADNFSAAFSSKGHKFRVTLPDDNFTAVVDREAIVKAVSNLLSNASKYTRDSISLECKPLADGQHFSIMVADNGQGIKPDDMPRLFDPFFQGHGNKPGTGIGLSIVKRIAEQHQGTVDVTSEPGHGTTFTITLPVAQAYSGENQPAQPASAPAKADSPAPTAVVQEQKPVMLIVDDNQDMLTFLVTTFMDKYEVISARDGSEALKILEESLVVKEGQKPTSTVDIIISDWMMAQTDGPELCSRMRQNAATRHIPFILLTAKTDSQSKVQAMQAGIDAFIEKPFAVKYLEACIQNLMSRRSDHNDTVTR
jgi:signal transduction histidine kinase/ligand-binding sensor domain-containing protein/FixJ family two-component response regulator